MALLSAFSKEELCQLYVHPSIPDVDICSAYYRFTDRDALRSFIPGRKFKNEICAISSGASNEHGKVHEKITQNRYNNYAMVRILRDAVWKMSRWYTKDLQQWIEREDPTCIFLAPGYAKFIYDIALTIAKKRDIPIVTYICDDYYFVKQPKGLTARLQLCLLKRKTEQLMRKTSKLVVICEELKAAYADFFEVDTEVIMTASEIKPLMISRSMQKPIREISYFGNLQCGRHTALAEFAAALDDLNRCRNLQYILNVFTPETDRQILAQLEKSSCVRLKGFVSGDAFAQAMAQTDFLLHTEAFDETSVDLVKNSVSTKIAESLASGIPLIAYGPAEIASMKHLIRNCCALVITRPEDLEAVLVEAEDLDVCKCVVEAARRTAQQYHSHSKNGGRIRQLLKEASNEVHL